MPPKPAGTHCDTVEKTTPSEQYGAFAGSSNGGGEDTGTVGTKEDEERIREVRIHDEISTSVKQDTKNDTLRTTPSVDNCKFDRKGYCKEHNYHAKKVTVSSKKWKDRGGGRGYGYVHSTTKKFQCDSRKSVHKKTEMFASDRLRDEPADIPRDVVLGLGGLPGHVDKKLKLSLDETAAGKSG